MSGVIARNGAEEPGWLVETAGALIAVVVGSLATAAGRRSIGAQTIVLAAWALASPWRHPAE